MLDKNNSCKTFSNINLLWGELIIEELYRLGITDICIAPGSRSTPLTLAAATHSGVQTHQHFDERGLAFFALGLAKSSKGLVAIITTSGTAVANLLPAIIEASNSSVPLVVLSADRPDELISCGANQAIKQRGIFSHYVGESVDLPTASPEVSASFLLQSIDYAVKATQLKLAPVHINCQFKEPLYPNSTLEDFSQYLLSVEQWYSSEQAFTQVHTSQTVEFPVLSLPSLNNKKGLIIFANIANVQGEHDVSANKIIEWAKQQGWPVFVDCQSSLKDNEDCIYYYDQLLHIPEFKRLLNQAEVIVQFGSKLISKRLLQFISSSKAEYWQVLAANNNQDPTHTLTHHLCLSTQQFFSAFQAQCGTHWNAPLIAWDVWFAGALQEFNLQSPDFTELSVTQTIAKLCPAHSTLFIGNSMPVRLFDMFATHKKKPLKVYTNRGASGIDGLVATMAGIASSESTAIMTMIIGDISLLHDLNSLALLQRLNKPSIVIVFNNDGGTIFNMLPVPTEHKIREQFYQLPHGLNFEKVSAMFDINYQTPQSMAELIQHYQSALIHAKSTIIELKFSPNETTDLVESIAQKLQKTTQL